LLNCRPDIIIPDIKKVIFIHGCFWHGHDCQRGHLPKTNNQFWANKIFRNQERDLKNYAELNKAGWYYLIIWACEIKKHNLDNLIGKLRDYIIE
jgi:DNA mismatch endonuclease Vsr